MTEYIFAASLEPLHTGDEFIRWPLHITLVPSFSAKSRQLSLIDTSPQGIFEFAELLRDKLAPYRPLLRRAGERALLGPKHTVPATPFKEPEALQGLHTMF